MTPEDIKPKVKERYIPLVKGSFSALMYQRSKGNNQHGLATNAGIQHLSEIIVYKTDKKGNYKTDQNGNPIEEIKKLELSTISKILANLKAIPRDEQINKLYVAILRHRHNCKTLSSDKINSKFFREVTQEMGIIEGFFEYKKRKWIQINNFLENPKIDNPIFLKRIRELFFEQTFYVKPQNFGNFSGIEPQDLADCLNQGRNIDKSFCSDTIDVNKAKFFYSFHTRLLGLFAIYFYAYNLSCEQGTKSLFWYNLMTVLDAFEDNLSIKFKDIITNLTNQIEKIAPIISEINRMDIETIKSELKQTLEDLNNSMIPCTCIVKKVDSEETITTFKVRQSEPYHLLEKIQELQTKYNGSFKIISVEPTLVHIIFIPHQDNPPDNPAGGNTQPRKPNPDSPDDDTNISELLISNSEEESIDFNVVFKTITQQYVEYSEDVIEYGLDKVWALVREMQKVSNGGMWLDNVTENEGKLELSLNANSNVFESLNELNDARQLSNLLGVNVISIDKKLSGITNLLDWFKGKIESVWRSPSELNLVGVLGDDGKILNITRGKPIVLTTTSKSHNLCLMVEVIQENNTDKQVTVFFKVCTLGDEKHLPSNLKLQVWEKGKILDEIISNQGQFINEIEIESDFGDRYEVKLVLDETEIRENFVINE